MTLTVSLLITSSTVEYVDSNLKPFRTFDTDSISAGAPMFKMSMVNIRVTCNRFSSDFYNCALSLAVRWYITLIYLRMFHCSLII